jgi:hypothetical protein
MTAMQLLGWFLFLLILGGLVVAYVVKGVKIKADKTRKHEDWPRITQGGTD